MQQENDCGCGHHEGHHEEQYEEKQEGQGGDCGCGGHGHHGHHGMMSERHHHGEGCGCGGQGHGGMGRGGMPSLREAWRSHPGCNCPWHMPGMMGGPMAMMGMHGGMEMGGGMAMGFGRRFISRDEIIARLEEYQKQLQAEAKGVEERIAELKKQGESSPA